MDNELEYCKDLYDLIEEYQIAVSPDDINSYYVSKTQCYIMFCSSNLEFNALHLSYDIVYLFKLAMFIITKNYWGPIAW